MSDPRRPRAFRIPPNGPQAPETAEAEPPPPADIRIVEEPFEIVDAADGTPVPVAARRRSPWGALLITALVNVSLVVPSAPGYVGTFELAAMIGYGLLGIDPDTAAVLTVATHAMLFFPGTAIGLICLWRENLSLALLGKSNLENGKAAVPTA